MQAVSITRSDSGMDGKDKCCCKNKYRDKMLKIVRGNDFTLNLALTRQSGADRYDSYDLTGWTPSVKIINSKTKEETIATFTVSDNIISVPVDGELLEVGTYDIEVVMVNGEQDARSYACKQFAIVETNAEAYLPRWVEFGDYDSSIIHMPMLVQVGLSAYEIALKHGFSGSEEEWLASLKGETGAAGPANTLSIGTVESGASASASISGTAPNQILNLVLPQGAGGQGGTAASVSYDNSESSLQASNLQSAIDEIATMLGGGEIIDVANHGFFVVDGDYNIGFQVTDSGIDAAILSSHIQSLLPSSSSDSDESVSSNYGFYDIPGIEYVNAIKKKADGIWTQNSDPNRYSSFPLIAHYSDIHGDSVRHQKIMDICQRLGVDIILNTGDSVADTWSSGMSFIESQVYDKNKYLQCVGNHDSSGSTVAQRYTVMFQPYANYITLNTADQNPTYGYKDLASKNLRIFFLDPFRLRQDGAWQQEAFGATQITWFISALKSTPASYGVIVMLHCNETAIEKNSKFYSSLRECNQITDYSIIADIIAAFQDRGTISKTYTNSYFTITLNEDFSSVASGVEFIMFASGHRHDDFVGTTVGTSSPLLNCNVVCATAANLVNGHDGNQGNDLSRIEGEPNEIAFNIYSINREDKTVSIIRIGSDIVVPNLTLNSALYPMRRDIDTVAYEIVM